MSLFESVLLSVTVTGSLWSLWYWLMQPLSLDSPDTAELRARLQHEPTWVREPILERGTVTRDEWARLHAGQQQAIARRHLRG